jgi:hypothetical protein
LIISYPWTVNVTGTRRSTISQPPIHHRHKLGKVLKTVLQGTL